MPEAAVQLAPLRRDPRPHVRLESGAELGIQSGTEELRLLQPGTEFGIQPGGGAEVGVAEEGRPLVGFVQAAA